LGGTTAIATIIVIAAATFTTTTFCCCCHCQHRCARSGGALYMRPDHHPELPTAQLVLQCAGAIDGGNDKCK
jgi:hypothetical protein